MRNRLLLICSVMLIPALNGCASTQPVAVCPEPPPPPAWLMSPAPNLLEPLNGIISPSENESPQQKSK